MTPEHLSRLQARLKDRCPAELHGAIDELVKEVQRQGDVIRQLRHRLELDQEQANPFKGMDLGE